MQLIRIWINENCVSSGENKTNWFGERTGRRVDDKETRDEEDLDDLQDLEDLEDLQDADLSDTRSKVTETFNLVHHIQSFYTHRELLLYWTFCST